MPQMRGMRGIVTGGAGGVGRATALAFAAAGADVAVLDLDEAGARARSDGGSADRGRIIFEQCDVSNSTSVQRAIDSAVIRLGGLDFAANVAGIHIESAPIVDCDEAVFDKVIAVNLRGTFLCLKHKLRHMRVARSGCIVNVSSVGGFEPQAGLPAYVASKHGVIGLTRNAALESAADGIRVNAVCPGLVDTPMLEAALSKQPDAAPPSNFCAMNRVGTADEIAAAILWLCSPGSAFVTGTSLVIDGGHLMR